MTSSEAIYPIGVVERITAFSARQIRYYEKCGLVSPARSAGNRRLFSERDIKLLLIIREKLNEGWALEGIKAALLSGDLMPELFTPTPQKQDEAGPRDEPPSRVQNLLSIFPVSNQAALERRLERKPWKGR